MKFSAFQAKLVWKTVHVLIDNRLSMIDDCKYNCPSSISNRPFSPSLKRDPAEDIYGFATFSLRASRDR
ncbi:MAG: hypothetical protein ACE5HX_04820 [bacterium]